MVKGQCVLMEKEKERLGKKRFKNDIIIIAAFQKYILAYSFI